ncbi:MAG: shikimate dehydrogenase [Cryomorphaceae bacterium]
MKRYGLIGTSLEHSFSPRYFKDKFKHLGLTNHHYGAFEISNLQELPHLLDTEHLIGFNITIPFKKEILPFLDEVDPTALRIGAVNCAHKKGVKWIGYNTDCYGFREALLELSNGRSLRKALVLGDGGAAQAVVHTLLELNVGYELVSRRGQKTFESLTASEVRAADLIVNTTPLGMYPNVATYPEIPYEALHSKHLVIDLIYNPEQTLFLKKASLTGAVVANGQRMLELQADKSWEIWSAE